MKKKEFDRANPFRNEDFFSSNLETSFVSAKKDRVELGHELCTDGRGYAEEEGEVRRHDLEVYRGCI